MSIQDLKRELQAVSQLRSEQRIDDALALVDSLLKQWPGNAQLHVLWSELVQLQDKPKYTLEEARKSLERAGELDEDSPAAAIELGYFNDNVEDNPKAAVKAFGKAVFIARKHLINALLGQAKAYRQLGQDGEANRCVLQLILLSSFDDESKRINKTKDDDQSALTFFLLQARHILRDKVPEEVDQYLDELVHCR